MAMENLQKRGSLVKESTAETNCRGLWRPKKISR